MSSGGGRLCFSKFVRHPLKSKSAERPGIFSPKGQWSGWEQQQHNNTTQQQQPNSPKAHTWFASLLSKLDLSVRLSNMLLMTRSCPASAQCRRTTLASPSTPQPILALCWLRSTEMLLTSDFWGICTLGDLDSSWYGICVLLYQNRPLIIFRGGTWYWACSLCQYIPLENGQWVKYTYPFLRLPASRPLRLRAGWLGPPVRASRAPQMSAGFSQTEKGKGWPSDKGQLSIRWCAHTW